MEHYADQEDEDEVREKPESWSLSAEEKQALEKVKEDFLTFEEIASESLAWKGIPLSW